VKLRPPKAKPNLLPMAEKAKPTRSPAKAKQLHEARLAAEAAIEAALDKKGLLPVVIDVSGQTTYTDFIGIVSGRSDRQVEAIAENVVLALKAIDFRLVGREGSGNGRWTLLDFGDVVIHVFYHPVREFYDIESLWIDAPRLKLKVPPEAMSVGDEALYYDRDPQRA
jgi:ribosome-associated protein